MCGAGICIEFINIRNGDDFNFTCMGLDENHKNNEYLSFLYSKENRFIDTAEQIKICNR